MGPMEDILIPALSLAAIVVLGAAATSVLVAWFFSGHQKAAALRNAPLARVWREGYLAGVADERTSAAWDVPGYGPNRVNPYPGDETQVVDA